MYQLGCLRGLTVIVVDHISQPPEFKSPRGHVRRLFHLSLRLITFGGRSAHSTYRMHKSGCKHQPSTIQMYQLIILVYTMLLLNLITLR